MRTRIATCWPLRSTLLALGLQFFGGALHAAELPVRYTTTDRAYFDFGERAGLRTGDRITIVRGGRELASCVLDQVSAGHASCPARGIRAGDGARYVPRSVVMAQGAVPSSTVGPGLLRETDEARAQIGAVLASRPFGLVEAGLFGGGDFMSAIELEAELGHESWVHADVVGGHRALERLDLSIRSAPLPFFGATASAEAMVLFWSARPEAARFRPDARAQLYVYETAVEARASGSPVVAAVGRIRPWYAPGLPLLDGLQAGWRSEDEALELGVLAGAVPDPLFLEPTTERWVTDAYLRALLGDRSWFLSEEVRVGAARGVERDVYGELESSLLVGLSSLRAGLGARGVLDDDGAALASARAHLDAELLKTWSLGLEGRTRDDRYDLFGRSLAPVGATHGSASTRWMVLDGLELSAFGGAGDLEDSDELTGWAGGGVSMPELFGAVGGLSLSHHESLGAFPGRTTWLQAMLRPASTLELLAHVALLEDRGADRVARDLGFYAHGDWRVLEILKLVASLHGQLGLGASAGDEDVSPAGLHARLGLILEL